jgi:hypothetical protein
MAKINNSFEGLNERERQGLNESPHADICKIFVS